MFLLRDESLSRRSAYGISRWRNGPINPILYPGTTLSIKKPYHCLFPHDSKAALILTSLGSCLLKTFFPCCDSRRVSGNEIAYVLRFLIARLIA